ncbi:putative Rmd1/YagE family protein [Paenibacillus phyllosphaerae]|uniref:Putative Rmd1/YagE family protein n=1 Tax=Paenibacillus phyllosphaerae TaxID=274593 RepID=A0A7W5B3W8_9BACL|nr:RMD1 family protein [Paenibacillus phyllosphaerae]MBB3113943.1 putative Rmd1/YagE family protein [Paenibacillus phyllosphaerae]
MDDITFKALAVANEIDLNKIAIHAGIRKKYTWEQPLMMKSNQLKKIYHRPVDSLQQVLIFSFGSVVFVNHSNMDEIHAFLRFIQSFEPGIHTKQAFQYTDDYKLHIEEIESMELTDEHVVVPAFEFFFPELIATVLAKSVALEKIEDQLGEIQDNLELMIDRLERGKLRVGNKELASTTAKIVRHEYNTLAYIMILDKPELTWTHNSASHFYDEMLKFFELNDRYTILKSKTDILYHILEGFSNISYSIRGLFVEWIVVILIVIEVVLTLLEIVGWIPAH